MSQDFSHLDKELPKHKLLDSHDDHDDDDDHEEHLDEGWLVSYADMMTLLFGLFVLLYSMSKLDKEEAQKIIESTQEKFGKKEMTLNDSKMLENEDLQKKIEQLLEEQKTLQAKMVEQETQIESLKIVEKESIALIKEKELQKNKEKDLERKIASLSKNEKDSNKFELKIDELKKQIALKKENEVKLQDRLKLLESKQLDQKQDDRKLASLQEKLDKKTQELVALKEKVVEKKDDKSSEKLVAQLDEMKKQIAIKKESEAKLLDRLKLLESKQLDQRQVDIKIASLQKELSVKDKDKQILDQKFLDLKEKASEKLKEKEELIAELKEKIKSSSRQVASIDTKEKEIEDLKKLLEKESQIKEEDQLSISKLKEKNKELEAKINSKNGDASSKSFLAVFINWPTEDHDIDLVVKDPTGKKFDFKNRKFGEHPGLFALDTRRGPGAELWQSDRIIPGVYTASYSFYNQYGNANPAKVLGTIYSPKGSVEIKAVEMKIDSKRQFEVKFKVDSEGEVKILNSN